MSKFVSGIVSDRSNASPRRASGRLRPACEYSSASRPRCGPCSAALNAFFRGFDRRVCARLLTASALAVPSAAAGGRCEHRAQCRRKILSLWLLSLPHYGWRVGNDGTIAAIGVAYLLLAAARPSAGDWFTAGRRLAARCAGGRPTARGRGAKSQRNPRQICC